MKLIYRAGTRRDSPRLNWMKRIVMAVDKRDMVARSAALVDDLNDLLLGRGPRHIMIGLGNGRFGGIGKEGRAGQAWKATEWKATEG